MKKKTTISFVIIGIILIACLIGLVATRRSIASGPFSFLHTWLDEISQITAEYCTGRQGEIIFYGSSNFALW